MSVEQIRHFKNLLENIEVLEEGQNYGEMFNDLLAIYKKYDFDSYYADLPPTEDIPQIISSAKSILKRKDRIVWFLRLWKVWTIGQIMKDFSEDRYDMPNLESFELLKTIFNNQVKYLTSKGTPQSTIDIYKEERFYVSEGHDLFAPLNHFLSLPIPEIQNFRFEFQGYNEVVNYFKQVEDKWKNEATNLIAYNPNDGEVLAKFNNGFFWLKLDRAICKDEGRAAKHCGNAGTRNPDERILSLRQMIKRGPQQFVKPFATFILHPDGFLGEMKGRANNKPEKELHPYIVALLKLPIIKGIRGGGYAPKNNFALSDLDEDTRDELLSQKPQLGSLRYHYNAIGLDDFLKTRIKDALGKNYKIYSDKKTDYLVVREFKELYDLIEKYGNSGAKWTRNTLHGAEIDDSITKILPLPEHNKDVFVLKHLKEEILINLAEYAKKKFGFRYDSETLSDDRTLKKLSKIIKDNDSKFDELINDSYLEGLADGTGDNSYFNLDRVLKEDHTGTLGVEIKIVTNDREDFAYSEEIYLIVPIKEVLYIIDHPKMLDVIKDKGWLEDFKITIKLRDLEYKYIGSRANRQIKQYIENAS